MLKVLQKENDILQSEVIEVVMFSQI